MQQHKRFRTKLQNYGGYNMPRLGIYEKALPLGDWKKKLSVAKQLGFSYVEMSIDESDERLQRLLWSKEERQSFVQLMQDIQMPVQSICLSGHRRYPLGSSNEETREIAIKMGKAAIKLARDLGVRNIQIAGYDVYYEKKSVTTREYFIAGLKELVKQATAYNVMLSIETMDDPFINSMDKFLEIKQQISSPWLQVYPDLGNLSAWNENVGYELEKGISHIAAIHLKDTYAVTATSKGQFRDVPFGKGCVDFNGCLRALKRLGYEGAFVLEMWSENDACSEEKIQEALSFMLPIMEEVGYDV